MKEKPDTSHAPLAGIVLCGLATSVGWGFRGDYGHEAGAMVPGALLALAICLASGRPDWWRRASIMAMCGAIGWAFGGQMSYGRITGYTASSSLPDVAYGYACLFVVGGLWAGIGSAILALSVTQSRSYLESYAGPLIALWLVWLGLDLSGSTAWLVGKWYLHDTDWVAASSALVVAVTYGAFFARGRPACALIAILAGGWWLGYAVLTVLLGLRMTPPRSDNWAGCVGLFAALLLYLFRKQDRTALMLALYGFVIGGIGFVLGDFVNMLGRAQAGPIGRHETLQALDYWKWMEQLFGLVMGLGVGTAFLRYVRPRLAPPQDDAKGKLSTIALLFLLLVMMWSNLYKNVRNWAKAGHIPEQLFGVATGWWFLLMGVIVSAMVVAAIIRHRRRGLALAPSSVFGRAQLLFLMILWIAIIGAFTQAFPGMANKGVFFVHLTFWLTAGACSLIVLAIGETAISPREPQLSPSDRFWQPGLKYWFNWLAIALLVLLLAYLTVSSHDKPLPGSHLRFDTSPQDQAQQSTR